MMVMKTARRTEQDLLGGYHNDHLAGATLESLRVSIAEQVLAGTGR
jgi:hypothetical protein